MNILQRYIKASWSLINSSIRLYFLKRKKIKYKLTKFDKDFIKMIKNKYDMVPNFNDDGTYFYDLKINPAFKSAIIKKTE